MATTQLRQLPGDDVQYWKTKYKDLETVHATHLAAHNKYVEKVATECESRRIRTMALAALFGYVIGSTD